MDIPQKVIQRYIAYVKSGNIRLVAKRVGLTHQAIWSSFKSYGLPMLPVLRKYNNQKKNSPKPAEELKILKMFKSGMPLWKVTIKSGHCRSMVVRVIRDAGFKSNMNANWFSRKVPRSKVKQLIKSYPRLSTVEIGRKYGISVPAVLRYLEMFKVKRRADCSHQKISPDDVSYICKAFINTPISELANKFNVSTTAIIYHIKKRFNDFLMCTRLSCAIRLRKANINKGAS